MLNLWPQDNTPLGEKARQLAIEFHKKKAEYMKIWVKELENMVQKEVLLSASLGEANAYFQIEKHIYDLKPFTEDYGGGISRSYTITEKDKSKLISELKTIFSDKANYPGIEVRIDEFGIGLLIYCE